jgi:hypothetical protein
VELGGGSTLGCKVAYQDWSLDELEELISVFDV